MKKNQSAKIEQRHRDFAETLMTWEESDEKAAQAIVDAEERVAKEEYKKAKKIIDSYELTLAEKDAEIERLRGAMGAPPNDIAGVPGSSEAAVLDGWQADRKALAEAQAWIARHLDPALDSEKKLAEAEARAEKAESWHKKANEQIEKYRAERDHLSDRLDGLSEILGVPAQHVRLEGAARAVLERAEKAEAETKRWEDAAFRACAGSVCTPEKPSETPCRPGLLIELRDELRERLARAISDGALRECDIPACNCGGYHSSYADRMMEESERLAALEKVAEAASNWRNELRVFYASKVDEPGWADRNPHTARLIAELDALEKGQKTEPPEHSGDIVACMVEQLADMNGEAFWGALRKLPVSKFVGPLRKEVERRWREIDAALDALPDTEQSGQAGDE